jgi:hypothetical protein
MSNDVSTTQSFPPRARESDVAVLQANLKFTVTIQNNLPYDFKLAADAYLTQGSTDDYPKGTIESYDTSDANAGKYHGKGGVEGVVGYVIPNTQKAIVVYFGNVGLENPVNYVDVFDTQSIQWGSSLVDTLKYSKKPKVSATIKINGVDQTVVVSVHCR